MRIVVSGGGTGGHIYPALAVCEALRNHDPECELLYVGSTSGMEAQIVPAAGVPYQGVTARKLRKLVSLSTVAVAVSLIQGFREARRYLEAFKPAAVVGTGGYVAAAAALAAASMHIPVVILAPDAIPGRTNLLLGRFARRICVVFAGSVTRFPAGRAEVTGLPLRSGVVAPPDVSAAQARARFPGLETDRFTVLVIGGSQGARAVNEIVVEALPDLIGAGMQVLHQTGPANLASVEEAVRALGLSGSVPHCPVAYLDEEQVRLAYRAADVIVCRGGISTLSEVMVNGLPSVIVPLPSAYADHQTANAQALAAAGAALCYPEFDLHAEGLTLELTQLKDAPERLVAMASATRAMAQPDAAARVANIVLNL